MIILGFNVGVAKYQNLDMMLANVVFNHSATHQNYYKGFRVVDLLFEIVK
ncbi:MAG: hypothetical protein V4547_04385 [Bacteroidota bacterium]